MRFMDHKRTITVALAVILVAGCSAEDGSGAADAAADGAEGQSTLSAESLEVAETAWLSVSADGDVFTTYLDLDGRYRDERGGEIVYGGTWEQNASRQLCFTPDSGEGDCWSHGAPGLNGVMRAKDSEGREIAVKRVAYTAPAGASEADQPDAETQGSRD